MKRRGWILLGVIAAVAAGFGGLQLVRGADGVGSGSGVDGGGATEVATAERGTVRVTVDGSGSLAPLREVPVSTKSGGRVTEVLVEEGDVVRAGDVLARLDATDAQSALEQAQLQVRQAEITLTSARMSLDDLTGWAPDADAVALAEASLAAAQADYNRARALAGHTGDQLTAARVKLTQAERELADAEEAYRSAFDPGREWELSDRRRQPILENEREVATNRLTNARESLEIAQANYNLEAAGVSDATLRGAWSQVVNAQNALRREQTAPTADEIARAQLQVDQADLSLADARLRLASAQRTLDETELVAPVDGTVTQFTLDGGQWVPGGQTVAVLADLGTLVVEIGLDESDIAQVAVGQAAIVTLDAFPGEELAGRVEHVAPTAEIQSGVALYRVTVVLDPVTLPVRAGMTANVEIVTGSAQDALIVPLKAVRSVDGRTFVLRRLRTGEAPANGAGGPEGTETAPAAPIGFVQEPVALGLTSDTYAEILSGLEEGDVVSVASTSASESQLGFGGPFGGAGRILGGGQ